MSVLNGLQENAWIERLNKLLKATTLLCTSYKKSSFMLEKYYHDCQIYKMRKAFSWRRSDWLYTNIIVHLRWCIKF